ncbi:hypothetical protein DPEC_G00056480 [Dallia pectoralis]|uniref:Uncharacterized protein n=1 Tax=Dallia pectoralis TaxID=75939 RepID=A0ACC2H6A1_DALPE|nr:hypothetical protein DPEC_G00056480 [Dallia pectoralis]
MASNPQRNFVQPFGKSEDRYKTDWRMLNWFGSTLWLILHLSYYGTTSLQNTTCPPGCQCFSSTTVICSDPTMILMPTNMSVQVKELIVMTTSLMDLRSTTLHYSPDLTKLVFLNNLLRHVSNMTFVRLTGLEELEISGNHWLDKLDPGTFSNQKNLTGLILNFNKFKSLKNGLFNSLQKLKTLQLKGNSISHLPGQLFQNLTSLCTLDLSLNNLTRVDGELFGSLSQLKSLSLGYNLINILLPNTFQNISKVKNICLEGNLISHLPCGLFLHLKELEVLNLRGNVITNVSSGTFPSSLQKLDLKDNRMATIQSVSFGGLTNLSHLFLSNNQLTDLPEAVFQNLGALQHLDLSANQLISLPGSIFQGLFSLEFVHLQSNNLSNLDATLFKDQTFLEQLYLSDNNLQTLPQGFLNTTVQENILRLDRNPWHCDCHMLYLHDYVVQHSHLVEDLSKVYCLGPRSLSGQNLVSVEREQLVCPSNISLIASADPFNCSVDESPRPGKCSVHVIDDHVTIKCKWSEVLSMSVNVLFEEEDGTTSEYILKKDRSDS